MKTHENDVKEEEERKENGRVKQLLPSQFPVQSLLLDYTHVTHAHTHSTVFGGGAIGQQRDAQRGGGLSAATQIRPPNCIELIELPFFFFFVHICWEINQFKLEVTVTEALIARVGKSVNASSDVEVMVQSLCF